jgi:hypothetical protein
MCLYINVYEDLNFVHVWILTVGIEVSKLQGIGAYKNVGVKVRGVEYGNRGMKAA